MTTKIMNYEQLIEKRDSLKQQMKSAMDNNDDLTLCRLYIDYKQIVEKIQDIDDYWNAHD